MVLSLTHQCCMVLSLDVGIVPTFWQRPSQPPPCLPKTKIVFIMLWSCPWHTSAVRCYFLTLGWFQLFHKGLPNLHGVCPRCKWSLSFYDLDLDTLVLYDAICWCWVCSNFLTKAFPTSAVSAQDVNDPVILWSCPWHTSALWCCFLTLGLFQLSDKSLPNLRRACPNWNASLSCYDLVLDTPVLHDAVSCCWVGSNFLTKAFPTSTMSAQHVNDLYHFMILSFTHQCCMMLFINVGFVPTFSQKPSQPPPCLPKVKIILIILWSCPWHASAVWCWYLCSVCSNFLTKAFPTSTVSAQYVNGPHQVMILSLTH